MIKILIVTHGEFGAYLLEAAEEIVGRDPESSIRALAISRRIPLSEVREKIETYLHHTLAVSNGDGVLVVCDMLGGTPCNETLLAARCLPPVEILTGVNLYMVVSAMMNFKKMTLSALAKKVAEDARRSITNAKELLSFR